MPLGHVTAVGDLTTLEGSPVHDTCSKAIVHQVDDAETSVFVVKPGGNVRTHVHSKVWDLFIGVEGEVEIVFQRAKKKDKALLGPKGFCAIPPAVIHEVTNLSDSKEAIFILVHAPWSTYDHVRTDFQEEPTDG